MAAARRKRKRVKTDQDVIRFGVSLPRSLLRKFDNLRDDKHYENRSEAIRDLIRKDLSEKSWLDGKAEQRAVLALVLETKRAANHRRLLEGRRRLGALLISDLQLRLNERQELHVLILRGTGEDLRVHMEELLGLKGVLLGKVISLGAAP